MRRRMPRFSLLRPRSPSAPVISHGTTRSLHRRPNAAKDRGQLMDTFPARDIAYVIGLEEIGWGCVLLALTIAIHGAVSFQILRVTFVLTNRRDRARSHELGVGIIILT